MIKGILKLGLLLVVGIVVYNYFLGTPEEKESSRRIFTEVKELGDSAIDLLKKEKDKFDAGKYDGAMEKIGTAFNTLREKAGTLAENGGKYLEKLNELEAQKKRLQEELETTKTNESDGEVLTEKGKRDMDDIEKRIEALVKETEKVAEEMNDNEK